LRRFLIVLEVAAVLALFLAARQWLGGLDLSGWQQSVFGGALISSVLLYLVLPLAAILVTRRGPGGFGLPASPLKPQLKDGLKACAILGPATVVFPIIGALGTTPIEWFGAAMLTAGFGGAGLVWLFRSGGVRDSTEGTAQGWASVLPFVGLLLVGFLAAWAINPWWPLGARLVRALVFVGFLEELFFRGYVQSRLNEGIGTPFRWRGIEFGYGLLLTAVVFGLFHPLTAPDPSWPWGLWTGMFGLVLGFVREKTGGFLAPAVIHSVLWLPGVFFGPA
jgi:CAAX protease family protein